jgi:hypothetical protein
MVYLFVYCIRYSLPAVSLATSTAVSLLPENFVIHNDKYFALCIDVTLLPRRTIVFVWAARDCRSSSTHSGFCRILAA